MAVEDGECGDAFGDGDLILGGDVNVVIHLADVHVDDDEVICKQVSVGLLIEVDVENLAVAAPVAAEVDDDAFILAAGLGDCGFDVGGGVRGGGVDVFGDKRESRCGGWLLLLLRFRLRLGGNGAGIWFCWFRFATHERRDRNEQKEGEG